MKTSRVGSESEKRNFDARKYGVTLKRRKICRNIAGKSVSSSQDTSLFSWGIGDGMMCMKSSQRTEFDKLNDAMNETTKVIEELKTELRKRKSLSRDGSEPMLSPTNDDVEECLSCALTEDNFSTGKPEIDQLEAELELELRKLPWCCSVDGFETEDSEDLDMYDQENVGGFSEEKRRDCESGVLAEELDQKLCHLIIQRQGSQIEELESELMSSSQRRLREKEAELRALKDCVKGLTQISLSTFSDDEAQPETEKRAEQ